MLYDTIKIVKFLDEIPKELKNGVNEPFYWNNCLWLPRYNKLGEIVSYYSHLNNLKLWLRGSELSITNSLQKFYCSNNHSPFSYSQVKDAIHLLMAHFDCDLSTAEVKKIAVGTVIDAFPEDTFNSWKQFKNINPSFMKNKTKIYGVNFKATNYNIKGYDKTYQVKAENGINLPKSVIRFECEAYAKYYNQRKNSIPIYKLSDLVDKNIFKQLSLDLLEIYGLIKKKKVIDFSKLSPVELKLLATYGHPEISLGLKKHHKHTYKKERQQYLKLIKDLPETNNEKEVFKKLKDQIHFCINT